MALFAEISGAKTLGNSFSGVQHRFQVRKIFVGQAQVRARSEFAAVIIWENPGWPGLVDHAQSR